MSDDDFPDETSEWLRQRLRKARLIDFSEWRVPHDMRNPHDEEDCIADDCEFCIEGVEACSVCGGSENTLTTHCPQELLLPQTELDIMSARIDYNTGKWIEL